jgi:hypothetical protein
MSLTSRQAEVMKKGIADLDRRAGHAAESVE